MMGARDGRQVIYDVEERSVVATLGTPDTFPQPGGDIALSPDGAWFVNGHSDATHNYYTVLRRSDETWARTPPMSRGAYTSGNLRIDGSPAWNRTNDAVLFPGLDATDGTRQIFVIHIRRDRRARTGTLAGARRSMPVRNRPRARFAGPSGNGRPERVGVKRRANAALDDSQEIHAAGGGRRGRGRSGPDP